MANRESILRNRSIKMLRRYVLPGTTGLRMRGRKGKFRDVATDVTVLYFCGRKFAAPVRPGPGSQPPRPKRRRTPRQGSSPER